MHSKLAQSLLAVVVGAGVGLATVATFAGCGEPRGSLCLEPAPGWDQRMLDREAIVAEGEAVFSDEARQMYDEGCVAVPRGVDSRNGAAIYATPFCDDNCAEDDRWAVVLYYDGVGTADDCIALGGCPIMRGAMPGSLAVCVPDGAPVWPTGGVCSTP